MKRRLRCLVGLILVFLCAAVTVGSRQLHGQAVVATVDVGDVPNDVCVNPNTNRVYVTNNDSNNVSVIDGATNQVIATIKVGDSPLDVDVNPNTNRVYVANNDSNNISVIDGATNQVFATVPVGCKPSGVSVNPNTNRVYANSSGNVSVIDGATNQVIATVPVGSDLSGVCVNPNTNRIYVADWGSNNVSVIDGTTNQVITTIKVGTRPRDVDVNPNTNRVYVANWCSRDPYMDKWYKGTISVIDGATNQVVATVPVRSKPSVGVNPNTNRVYVTNWGSKDYNEDKWYEGTVRVIGGATNQVIATVPVGTELFAVGVNPNTNRVYVANWGSRNPYTDKWDKGTVSVIEGANESGQQARRDEFIKKNGVEEWPDISELYVNPFVSEGKIVALRVTFREMQTATQGIFAEVDSTDKQPFVVSDIPKGMFKKSGTIVVLAGKVLGKTELQVPLLGLRQVPHLKFVGVYFCQKYNCSDIIPY